MTLEAGIHRFREAIIGVERWGKIRGYVAQEVGFEDGVLSPGALKKSPKNFKKNVFLKKVYESTYEACGCRRKGWYSRSHGDDDRMVDSAILKYV